MLTALALLLAPVALYLASLPLTARLAPVLRHAYRWLGGALVLGGGAGSAWLAFHGGDQGGIAAYFLQRTVIGAYLVLCLGVLVGQWLGARVRARG